MKSILSITLISLLLFSCAGVQVSSDYDSRASFPQYKTFAFLKEGIDKAEISDLDKKRILRSIEAEMIKKGYTLSENPDIFINFFTRERERQDLYQSVGIGWGWGPVWGSSVQVSPAVTEGVLLIDIIDGKKKDLIWQGKGAGILSERANKDEQIHKFVSEILKQYPPEEKRTTEKN
jgi:hypothetical protein